jgi:hypothetical protein
MMKRVVLVCAVHRKRLNLFKLKFQRSNLGERFIPRTKESEKSQKESHAAFQTDHQERRERESGSEEGSVDPAREEAPPARGAGRGSCLLLLKAREISLTKATEF